MQAQGRLHKSKPFADKAWKIRFDHRADMALKRLQGEMRQGREDAHGDVQALYHRLGEILDGKERGKSAIRRTTKTLQKTQKAIAACKVESLSITHQS